MTETWKKTSSTGSNVCVLPDQSWEAGSVYEPHVFYDPNATPKFVMFYSYGWATPGTARAISNDGVTWTGKTKVFGNGPVISGPAFHGRIQQKADGTFIYTYSTANVAPCDLMVSTSTDGINFSSPVVLIAGSSIYPGIVGGWVVQFENHFVRLFASVAADNYATHYAVGPSEDGPWYTAPPVTPPYPGGAKFANGFFSTGPIWKRGNVYHAFGNGALLGLAPSDVYRATSTNLKDWTLANAGNPIVTKTLSWERHDQVADAWPIEVVANVGGTNYNYTYLYYDAVDNANAWAGIGVAWNEGRLDELP